MTLNKYTTTREARKRYPLIASVSTAFVLHPVKDILPISRKPLAQDDVSVPGSREKFLVVVDVVRPRKQYFEIPSAHELLVRENDERPLLDAELRKVSLLELGDRPRRP